MYPTYEIFHNVFLNNEYHANFHFPRNSQDVFEIRMACSALLIGNGDRTKLSFRFMDQCSLVCSVICVSILNSQT